MKVTKFACAKCQKSERQISMFRFRFVWHQQYIAKSRTFVLNQYTYLVLPHTHTRMRSLLLFQLSHLQTAKEPISRQISDGKIFLLSERMGSKTKNHSISFLYFIPMRNKHKIRNLTTGRRFFFALCSSTVNN